MVIMALRKNTIHDFFGDIKLSHRRYITEERAKRLIQRQLASQSSNQYKREKLAVHG